ncbi:MAG: hypothetical protein ACP5MZ_02875 [Candidatus Micrarchaeia archaeon]
MNAALATQAVQLAALIVAVVILLWQSYIDRKSRKEFNLYLLGLAYTFVIASIFLLFFNHVYSILIIFGISLVSCSSVYQYLRHRAIFSVSMLYLLAAISYFYAVTSIPGIVVAAQSISIGLIAAFIAKSHAPKAVRPARSNKRIEIRRDVFEMAMGVVLFLIIALVRYYSAVYIVVLLSLFGYSISGLLKHKSRIYVFLNSLERTGAFFGEGAVYLAVGTLLMVSFIHARPLLLAGIIALFFSDSLATIVGITYGKHKLAYNRSKSVEGALVFWISASILAYPLIGPYSLLIGAVLSAVESVSGMHTIDDNISIAIAMIAIYAIALLA